MAKILFGLAFGPVATGFLDEMPSGKIRRQITQKAKALITDPYPAGCKKLFGMEDADGQIWRIRSGDYRILYVVRDTEIVVLDIGHRKDIYR